MAYIRTQQRVITKMLELGIKKDTIKLLDLHFRIVPQDYGSPHPLNENDRMEQPNLFDGKDGLMRITEL